MPQYDNEKIIVDKTIANQVLERLRNDIISNRFQAGSRITIKEISELYGVSNMPVREAFRVLAGEKLLEMNPYKGATILTINEQFIKETYGLLRAFELLIIETALDLILPEELEKVRAINAEIAQLQDTQEDRLRYITLNTQFHNKILSWGQNAKAYELFIYYQSLIRSVRMQYTPNYHRVLQAAVQHEAILQAIVDRDVVALKRAVDEHSVSAMNNFLSQYQEER